MKKLLLSAIAVCGFASMAFAADYATGSLEAPLSVTEYLQGGAPAKGSGVPNTYVQGYIVGSINGTTAEQSNLQTAAPFSLYSNIVIAASSSETDITRCVIVQLVSKTDPRAALNLGDNPQNLGHQVIIEGTRETYMNVVGLKEAASYKWVGEAPTPGEGGDDPITGNAIYTGLTKDSYTDWTIDNGDLAEGISYVWKWDESYNYMKASAYVSGTRYVTSAKLISPVIDLTNYTDCELSATNIINFANGKVADFCKTYVQAQGEEPVLVDLQPMPAGNTWAEKIEGKASLKAFEGKKIQVIFNYISTTEDAATWEVYNVTVNGTAASAVEEIAVEEGDAIYFNLQGAQVANPANGIYVKVVNGKASKVYVK